MKQVKYWIEAIIAFPFALIELLCICLTGVIMSEDNDKFEKIGEFLD